MIRSNDTVSTPPVSVESDKETLIIDSPEASVSILMGTYNGEAFLREQLDSILAQTHKNWKLYISDDGSTDRTLAIISEYVNKCPAGKISVILGPKQGFAQNFFSLLQKRNINSDYFAFSDQDDIWLPNKIEDAVKIVIKTKKEKATDNILYASRTFLVDSCGSKIGQSRVPKRALTFRNALVENYASGNTMLFTKSLREIIFDLPSSTKIIAHDWLLYLLASASGGEIYFDKNSSILYRQHENNAIGGTNKLTSRVKNYINIFKNKENNRKEINSKILSSIKNRITHKNAQTLYLYQKNGKSRINNIYYFFKSGVYRQKILETLALSLTNNP